MSQIKVVWYVLRVKNMHLGSPSDPSGTTAAKGKLRYIYSIVKPYGQSFRWQVRLLLCDAELSYESFRSPVRPLLSEAKPSYVYLILKPHPDGQSSKSPFRLLPCEVKLSYVYTIFKNITSPELVPSSCVLQHT